MNARIEGGRRSLQCLETHRAGDVRDAGEAFRAQQSEPADRVHRLRSIQERETLLGFQYRRRQSGFVQRVQTRQPFVAVERFAFADQHQRKMRQRRQISARTDRTLFRDDWMHAAIQQFAQKLDHFKTDAAQPQRQHIGAQQDHRAHFRDRERPADAAGVAAHEI